MDFKKKEILDYVLSKIGNILNLKDFPFYNLSEKWFLNKKGHWTDGFSIDLLWFAYKISGDNRYRENVYK
ncbi:MAG: hypothetical protein ACFFAN_00560 [Promethearchaeota archaeon]